VADHVGRLAAGLRDAGVKRGDRVLLRLGNEPLLAFSFFACLSVGAVAIPVSGQLTGNEVARVMADATPAVALTDPALPLPLPIKIPAECVCIDANRFWRASKALPPRGPVACPADTGAYLVYTSGTTAAPKGVLHAHRAVWGRAPMYQGWYGLRADDCVLHAGALNWTYTLGTGLMDPWAHGATAAIVTGHAALDADLWPGVIETHGATIFAAVPGIFRRLARTSATAALGKLDRFRHGLTAGDRLPSAVHAGWTSATGKPLYQALGMSELSTFISFGPNVPAEVISSHPEATGIAQPGRRVAVLSESDFEAGRLTVLADLASASPQTDETPRAKPGSAKPGSANPKPMQTSLRPAHANATATVEPVCGLLAVHRSDPGLMLGYWQRPQEEAAVLHGDWFVGGDRVSVNVAGIVTHLGRTSDVMNAQGYRVSPLEVEAVIGDVLGVQELAVTEWAVRDDVTVIAGFIVAQSDGALDEVALFNALTTATRRLAAYKRPKTWRLVTALPRTANGKIQRRALASLQSRALTTP
ncbi:MAG: acyl-CoA synthetase, partial [Pseudomonadota bacterium]